MYIFQEESHNFLIKGMAKPRIMFIHGVDEKTPDVESLAEKPPPTEDEGKNYLNKMISHKDWYQYYPEGAFKLHFLLLSAEV